MNSNLSIEKEWIRALLDGKLDGSERYGIRIGFKPVWMRSKVRCVLEIICTSEGPMNGIIARRIESPPMDIDDTLTITEVSNMFRTVVS